MERHLTSHNLSMAKLGPTYEVELEQGRDVVVRDFSADEWESCGNGLCFDGSGVESEVVL